MAGFYRSTVAIARVLLALALVLSVASTTTPTQLADGFSVLLMPLRLIRVDVDGLSIALSIALRAIPLTLEELDRIRAAQRARGFNFESGSIVERIKKWFTLLVPLTVSLFQRADQMAQTCNAVAGLQRCSAGVCCRVACAFFEPTIQSLCCAKSLFRELHELRNVTE